MKALLTQILSDDGGNVSSMRLAMLVALFIVLAVWAYVSICSKALQPLPGDIVNLLGVLIAGKTVQKFTETKASPASDRAVASGEKPTIQPTI